MVDTSSLKVFEQKIIRKMYGPVKLVVTMRQILYLKEEIKMIYCLGHVERIDQDRQTKRILYGEVGGVRWLERWRRCWMEAVQADLGRMGVRNAWQEEVVGGLKHFGRRRFGRDVTLLGYTAALSG